ncbi:metallophosphoesterase [Streptomyces tanashiensis]
MTEISNTQAAAQDAQGASPGGLQRLMRYLPLIAPVLLWAVPCWILLHTG